MYRFAALIIAAVALATFSASSAEAQSFHNGFQFGSGLQAASGSRSGFGSGFNSGGCCGGRISSSRSNLPYFAQFPPVYYSGIVKRPYGISPFAAPAGVTPVELTIPVRPKTVKNPYFGRPLAPVKSGVKVDKTLKNQTTLIVNPHWTDPMIGEIVAN